MGSYFSSFFSTTKDEVEVKKEDTAAKKSVTIDHNRSEAFLAKVRALPVPSLQQIIDILVEVMVDPHADALALHAKKGGRPSLCEDDTSTTLHKLSSAAEIRTVGRLRRLYDFAAIFIAKRELTAETTFLTRVLSYLTMGKETSEPLTNRHQREAKLIGLLEAKSSPLNQQFDIDSLVSKAKMAEFHQVCVILYKKKGDYIRTLDSYILAAQQNKNNAACVFEYIHEVVNDETLPKEMRKLVRTAALQRLPDLVQACPDLSARLIITCFATDNDRVVKALEKYPDLQFQYLRSIMRGRLESTTDRVGEEIDLSELMVQHGLRLSPELHELYIGLLCRFAPKEVYSHLNSNTTYHIDNILRLCQQYGINDATAYLLERTGDTDGALALTLKTVDQRVNALRQSVEEHYQDIEQNTVLEKEVTKPVRDIISIAIMLCERSMDAEDLWFNLLDHFVQLQRNFKRKGEREGNAGSPNPKAKAGDGSKLFKTFEVMEQALYDFVRLILDSMMCHVALPSILRKITSDHQEEEFREFRDTIQGMLDTYSYESNIIQTANSLMKGDMFRSIDTLHKNQRRAIAPRANACGTCNRGLFEKSGLMVFNCTHAFHEKCLGRNQVACPSCQTQQKQSSSKTRASITTNPAATKEGGGGGGDGSVKAKRLRANEKSSALYLRRLQKMQRGQASRSNFDDMTSKFNRRTCDVVNDRLPVPRVQKTVKRNRQPGLLSASEGS